MSKKIYVNQTKLTVSFDLDADITGYSSVTAAVRDPDGAVAASWTCTVDTASTGAVSFSTFTTTTFATSGTYLIQPVVTFSDTTVLRAETAKLIVYKVFE